MMTWLNIFVIFLLQIFGLFEVTSVHISKSISPQPLQVGKPAILKWTITYDKQEKSKNTFLFRKGVKDEIGSDSGGLTAEGKQIFKNKANITITEHEVIVTFHKLEYWDEFHFICKSSGGEIGATPNVQESTLSVVGAKGGPSFCDTKPKDEYFFELGSSSFDITMCGHEQPILSYSFGGKTFDAEFIMVDSRTRKYKYTIKLTDLKASDCGQELKFKGRGFGTLDHTSKVILKYTPSKIESFEYSKGMAQNCTKFTIKDEINTKCPLKYIITGYDKNKEFVRIAEQATNPITIDSNTATLCFKTWFDKCEFATVQPLWKHDSFQDEYKGEVSAMIRAERGFHDTIKPTDEKSKSLTFVIPLVLGILIIIIIVASVFIYKYKHKKRNEGTNNQVDGEDGLIKKAKDNEYSDIGNKEPEKYSPGSAPNSEIQHYEPVTSKPNVCIYSDLGEGGGRKGAKPSVEPSNYAEVKEIDLPMNHNNDQQPQKRRKDVFDPVESGSDDDDCEIRIPESGPIYPPGYTRNDGLPVYMDPSSSIRKNPPQQAYYERKSAPGMPKLPPVPYPKFNR